MIDQTSRTKFMRKKIEKKPTKRMYQTSISQVATRPVRLMALTRCRILVKNMVRSWSSLVEGGEGSYLPNCQTT